MNEENMNARRGDKTRDNKTARQGNLQLTQINAGGKQTQRGN